MPDERICGVCGRTNPADQPRCINCGQRAQGVMLVAEKPATTSSWWSSSTESRAGAIPAPPQVREEIERAETLRLDQERRQAERERRLQAAKERDERLRASRNAAATDDSAVTRLFFETPGMAPETTAAPVATTAPVAVAALEADCSRCGMPLEKTASGEGFSFCLRCGTSATPGVASVAAQTASPVEQFAKANNDAAVHAAAVHAAATATGGQRVRIAQTVAVAERPTMGVSPGLAATMSFFVPGIGQLVNGQVAKAALLFLAMFVLIGTFHLAPFTLFAIAARAMAAMDAYRIAERRRKGSQVSDGEWDLG